MEENKNSESFTYTYSAKQQEEVNAIRQKYIPREEDKMEQLRRLDKSAQKPGTIISLIIGITGTLVMGTGMSCVMVLTDYFFIGVVIGIIGMAGIALALPIYRMVTKRQREKLAPQIRQLTDELMKQQ